MGDVIQLQRGFDITVKEQRSGNVPVVLSGGIRSNHDTATSQPPGVVIGRKGTLGRTFFLTDAYWPHDTTLWVRDFKGNEPRFVYYLLQTLDFARFDVGSANPTLNRNHVHPLPVVLPAVEEQGGIAETLGALDDKIDSNRRLSVLLSDLVIAEFARLASSATGEQPLSELATSVKGVSYRRDDLQPSSTAMVSLKCFDRHGGFRPDGLKPFAGRYRPDQQVLHGELAIAQTDLTQGAEVVGRVVRVPPDSGYELLVASLDVVIVRPVDPTPPEFLYGVLLDDRFREHCRSRTSGTTVLHLSRDALSSYRAPRIDSLRQTQYAESVRPLIHRRERAEVESRRLADLRDTLLPELLSGRIRVPEAREAVESVG